MHRTRGERIFGVFNIIIVTLITSTCILPFLNVLAKSLSDKVSVLAKEVYFWPKNPNFLAYNYVMNNSQFIRAMLNSVFITVTGTALALFITVLTAFVFTRQNLPLQKLITGLFIVTMFFGGGMIPTYILYKQMGMLDTYAVLILPGAVGVFNIILMRNFFESISISLEESAKLDGASNIRVLFQIYIPLSAAAIATINLFFAVGKWNAYNAKDCLRENVGYTNKPIGCIIRQNRSIERIRHHRHSRRLAQTRSFVCSAIWHPLWQHRSQPDHRRSVRQRIGCDVGCDAGHTNLRGDRRGGRLGCGYDG